MRNDIQSVPGSIDLGNDIVVMADISASLKDYIHEGWSQFSIVHL